MEMLMLLHHAMHQLGRVLAFLTILGLLAFLFFAPIVALGLASIFIAIGVVDVVGGGGYWVMVPVFCLTIVFGGRYVFPCLRDPISGAMSALLKPIPEEAS